MKGAQKPQAQSERLQLFPLDEVDFDPMADLTPPLGEHGAKARGPEGDTWQSALPQLCRHSVGVNPGFKLVNNPDAPQIAEEYMRSFKVLRALPCDVPLASHPQMYNLAEKYPRIGKGPNPFIDPAGYKAEIDLREKVFLRELESQKKAAGLV